MNIYTHVLPDRQRAALDKLGDALDETGRGDDDAPPGTLAGAR
ncbi:hypothetical protein [Allosalinactinospora lopnorensis]|nr:hypothetical protein [Allosalinactinospora lopnorensis]